MENSVVKRKPGFQKGYDPNRNNRGAGVGSFTFLRVAAQAVLREKVDVAGDKQTRLMSILRQMASLAQAGDMKAVEFMMISAFGRPPVEAPVAASESNPDAPKGLVLYVRTPEEMERAISKGAKVLGPGEEPA